MGKTKTDVILLVNWPEITKTKESRGWGLKNIFVFNQDLVAKSICKLLFNDGQWGKLLKAKYMETKDPEDWIRH